MKFGIEEKECQHLLFSAQIQHFQAQPESRKVGAMSQGRHSYVFLWQDVAVYAKVTPWPETWVHAHLVIKSTIMAKRNKELPICTASFGISTHHNL